MLRRRVDFNLDAAFIIRVGGRAADWFVRAQGRRPHGVGPVILPGRKLADQIPAPFFGFQLFIQLPADGKLLVSCRNGGQPGQIRPIEGRWLLLKGVSLDALEPPRVSLLDEGLPSCVGRYRQQPARDVPRQLRRPGRPGVPAEKAEIAEQQLGAGGRGFLCGVRFPHQPLQAGPDHGFPHALEQWGDGGQLLFCQLMHVRPPVYSVSASLSPVGGSSCITGSPARRSALWV